jgi:glycosyltransferase involved in cell wall biosynthesis
MTSIRSRFRSLLPFYAAYFGLLRVDADLVISSSIAFTKAVRTPRSSFHVSYVYTPMRYAWDLDTYLGQSSYPLHARAAARAVRPLMRAWDRRTASRPNKLIAISRTVEERIHRYWGRDVDEVIYPPVPVGEIALGRRDDGFLLVAARLLSYRRIDLAVRACTDLGRELIVVGDGPERRRLEEMAGPSVTFLGHVPRKHLVDLFQRCHAYLMPGIEDFGIAPVEAMAAGKPVIAFDAGGARETVVSGITGILVERQDVPAFADAIRLLDTMRLDARAARERARLFDVSVFKQRWREYLLSHGFDVGSLTS